MDEANSLEINAEGTVVGVKSAPITDFNILSVQNVKIVTNTGAVITFDKAKLAIAPVTFYQKYQFTELSQGLVENLIRFGLSEPQVMGCEHHLRNFRATDPAKHLSAVNILATAAKDDVMVERSYFQKQYQKFGPLHMTPVGIADAQDRMRERERLEQRRAEAARERLAEQERLVEEEHQRNLKRQKSKDGLSKFRELPDDFTLDDL